MQIDVDSNHSLRNSAVHWMMEGLGEEKKKKSRNFFCFW